MLTVTPGRIADESSVTVPVMVAVVALVVCADAAPAATEQQHRTEHQLPE